MLREPGRGYRRHRGPAACARHHVPLARRCAPFARHPARRGRRPLGRRVLRARRCGHALASATRLRSSASAGSRWRRPPAASRLDGGDPRSRRRGGRGALPQDPQRVAGELQLPGPARHLGRDAVGRRGDRRGDARRRTPRDQAARVRRVPLAARRARRGATSPRRREGASRREQGGVHVDGDRAHRGGAALPRGARRPADRAGPLHAGGARADRRRRDDVRRGRPRQRARRFTEEDRQVRRARSRSATSRRSTRSPKRLAECTFASLDGKLALVTGASRGIGRAIAEELARAGAICRRRLPLGQGRGRRARDRDRRSRDPGGRVVAPTRRSGSSKRRATSTSSSTTPV